MIELGATRRDLQPDWVARYESGGRNTLARLPTGCPFVMRGQIRRRVQTQTSNDCVSVTVASINRDPFAASAFAVLSKFGRANWGFEQTSAAKRVRNCSGAIVAAISERFVAAAPNVRLAEELVRRPDRAFDCEWRGCRRECFAATQTCFVSGHGWTRSREQACARGRRTHNGGQKSRPD